MQTKSLVLPVIFSYWLVASDLGDIATNYMHQTGILNMFQPNARLSATSAEALQAKI